MKKLLFLSLLLFSVLNLRAQDYLPIIEPNPKDKYNGDTAYRAFTVLVDKQTIITEIKISKYDVEDVVTQTEKDSIIAGDRRVALQGQIDETEKLLSILHDELEDLRAKKK